jgi:hypothetical protein
MIALTPDFGSPVIALVGIICTWILVFFPFALWCRQIARADALSPVEAFILGQACGPIGLYLVRRANKAAAAAAYRRDLVLDELKKPDHRTPGAPVQEVQRNLREQGAPTIAEMPGAQAFRLKHAVRPAAPTRELERVGLNDPVRPEAPVHDTPPPLEPKAPPPRKAGHAWQPPPADYKFTHSDEDSRGGDETRA